MPSLSTYISVPGTALEALTFYHDVFGGTLNLLKYGDSPEERAPFHPGSTSSGPYST